jgi:hypothetical protein
MAETVERTCPVCGLPQRQWKENNGQGYTIGGQTFCCRGCAETQAATPRTAATAAEAEPDTANSGCTCV